MTWLPGIIAGLILLLIICIGAVTLGRINETHAEDQDAEPLGDLIDIKDFLNRWEDKA